MAPPLALLAVLMVTGLQGQVWVGGAPPGWRMLQRCALLSRWGWVGPGQGLVRNEPVSLYTRPSRKHQQLRKAPACDLRQPCAREYQVPEGPRQSPGCPWQMPRLSAPEVLQQVPNLF